MTRTAATVNRKGGNQIRIVRTQDGVFTAYIVEGGGEFSHEWRLTRRRPDGMWAVIAQGDAGAFPVSLLASPDGTLHIIGWSYGSGMIWSGQPKDGALTMRATTIPVRFRATTRTHQPASMRPAISVFSRAAKLCLTLPRKADTYRHSFGARAISPHNRSG